MSNNIVYIVTNHEQKNITVKDYNKKSYKVVCNFYLPVYKGDAISCPKPINNLVILDKMPKLLNKIDGEALKAVLFATVKKHKAVNLSFRTIHYICSNINYIDDISSYAQAVDIDNLRIKLDFEEHIPNEFIIDFCNMWMFMIVDKRLAFLTLKKSEIAESEYDKINLLEVATKSPFKLFHLPIERCGIIADINDITVDKFSVFGHTVGKFLYKRLKDSSSLSINEKLFKNILKQKLQEDSAYDMMRTELKESFNIHIHEGFVYTEASWSIESIVYNFLRKLANTRSPTRKTVVKKKLENIMLPKPPIWLSDEQKDAFVSAMKEEIVIISGSAGSGKSTLTCSIIEGLLEQGLIVQVTSFTGKAVARIREIWSDKHEDSINAETMDRLLYSTKKRFNVLLIDEASMVSTELMSRFLKRYNGSYRIIFVGDNNQMKPIGQGSLFYDLYKSCSVKTHLLKINHRTVTDYTDNKVLKSNINSLISNKPVLEEGSDFRIISLNPGEDIKFLKRTIKTLHDNKIPHDQVRILSFFSEPLMLLNQLVIKEYFDKHVHANTFVAGQRIMVNKNNYEHDIMNGDEGFVLEFIPDKHMIIQFPFGNVKLEDYSNIIHGYASTIHKAQGSEYTHVILYLQKRNQDPGKFLSINLLYTTISRAKKFVYVVGETSYLTKCTQNTIVYGHSTLSIRIRAAGNITKECESFINYIEEDIDDEDFDYDSD